MKADLAKLLEEQSGRHLHKLAKGRIQGHFRMGRKRLIQAFLHLPPVQHKAILLEIEQLSSHTFPKKGKGQSVHKQPRSSILLKKGNQTDLLVKAQDREPEASVTVEELLKGIGVPLPQPFQPDPWQMEAVSKLAICDVIVSVPTGSGKTYVAVQAMQQAMESERTVIYTSPLKALSNTKMTEFSQLFGPEQVGILTGDRRDNPHAPILIMTTEILRNLLYDGACGEIDMRLDTLGLVIMDESQYLADPERGVVWEETIILCPSQARLLLLSASIGNPDEIANWMSRIRPTACHLILHKNRSVPLRGGYLHPTGHLTPLLRSRDIVQGQGYELHLETKKLFTHYEEETLGGRFRRW